VIVGANSRNVQPRLLPSWYRLQTRNLFETGRNPSWHLFLSDADGLDDTLVHVGEHVALAVPVTVVSHVSPPFLRGKPLLVPPLTALLDVRHVRGVDVRPLGAQHGNVAGQYLDNRRCRPACGAARVTFCKGKVRHGCIHLQPGPLGVGR
jgi:hypothetical protein